MKPHQFVGGLAAAVGIGLCGLLTACGSAPPVPTDVTTDLDRDRAAYLSAEPILDAALDPPQVHPGVVHSEKLGWDRTEVSALVYQAPEHSNPTAVAVEQEVTGLAGQLRASGWTIHWEMCLPPPRFDANTGSMIRETIPVAVPRAHGFQWLVSGYKLDRGVSYWALVVAILTNQGKASATVVLRAPNARDEANLFGPAPPGIDPAAGCAENATPSEETEQTGTPTMIRDWWPFPGQQRARDPLQV